jgi:hypothetical protein
MSRNHACALTARCVSRFEKPTLLGTEDTIGREVRRGAQAVPGRAQPMHLFRAKRPNQLPLFGRPDCGGQAVGEP